MHMKSVGQSGEGSGMQSEPSVKARIFGYHRVSDSPNPALIDWTISPVQLDEQMRYLNESGYECVTCSELLRRFSIAQPLDRVVALTFDDGYLDTVTTAAPILTRYGFVATVFVVSDLIGKTAEWDARYGGPMAPLASALELRQLMSLGWEIGYHTRRHEALTTLTDDEIRSDMSEGMATLTAAIGAPVHTFAYPFSRQDERVRAVMVDTPFTGIFAAGSPFASPASPREAIERVFPLNRHTLADFRSLLETGLDLAAHGDHAST